MKELLVKFLIVSLLSILGTVRSEDSASGIIIYKTSPSSSDEFAITIEFSRIEVHPRAVTGVKADGSSINLPTTNVVAYFNYPNLKNGTIFSTTQVAEFMELGKRMVEAAGKYPTAAKAMGDRLEEMKTAAVKLNQGWFLVGGEWKQSMSQDNGKANQPIPEDPKILKTKTGQSYGFRAVKQYSSNQVVIEHDGGVARIDLVNLTEESLALLNQDADFKQAKKAQEDNEAAMVAQRTAAAEESIKAVRTELQKRKDLWQKSISKGDPSGNLKKLAQLVKSEDATIKDWRDGIGDNLNGDQVASFSDLCKIVGRPDSARKEPFGSGKWVAKEAVRCVYYDGYKNEITGKSERITIIAIPELDAVVSLVDSDSDAGANFLFKKVFLPYQEYYDLLCSDAWRFNTETLKSWGVEIPLLLDMHEQKSPEEKLEDLNKKTKLLAIQNALGLQNIVDQYLKDIGELSK